MTRQKGENTMNEIPEGEFADWTDEDLCNEVRYLRKDASAQRAYSEALEACGEVLRMTRVHKNCCVAAPEWWFLKVQEALAALDTAMDLKDRASSVFDHRYDFSVEKQ
jgi:hypothetical protein